MATTPSSELLNGENKPLMSLTYLFEHGVGFSLTYLYECGVIEGTSSTITHKVLPSLVRLSRKDVHKIAVRTEAITALGLWHCYLG